MTSFMICYSFKRLTDTNSKLWAYQKSVWFDGYIEFCGALNGLHEIHMKTLRTSR